MWLWHPPDLHLISTRARSKTKLPPNLALLTRLRISPLVSCLFCCLRCIRNTISRLSLRPTFLFFLPFTLLFSGFAKFRALFLLCLFHSELLRLLPRAFLPSVAVFVACARNVHTQLSLRFFLLLTASLHPILHSPFAIILCIPSRTPVDITPPTSRTSHLQHLR